MTVSTYLLGNQVTLTGRFYSDAAKTIPADPTTVTLSIRDPNRVVTTPAVVNAGVGIRTYAWTPTIAGMYEINWAGTGAVVSADQDPIYINIGINLGVLYLSPDQLKSTLEMTGTSFADADVTLAIGAASRAVDEITGRRFWLDSDNTKIRYYTPRSAKLLQIDDLVALGTNAISIDRAGTGTYSEVWTNGVDYVLEPFNGPAENPARPYETVRVRYLTTGRWFPVWIEKSVQVTGQFGWAQIPDDVTAATGILAAKLLRRSREAPFGIITAGMDVGVAMRISRTDPDVYMLLRDYTRHEPFV
jgi:hypothetical protein